MTASSSSDGGLNWNDNGQDAYEETDLFLPKGPVSALYRLTQCEGSCNSRLGTRSTCSVGYNNNHPLAFKDNGGQNSFYCVDEMKPEREQLSAKYRLWCQNRCRRETGKHYFCDTLYGRDHCSPQDGVSSQGKSCAYPCEKYDSLIDEYYFCFTTRDNSTWEYCGNWNVPEMKRKVPVEFTR